MKNIPFFLLSFFLLLLCSCADGGGGGVESNSFSKELRGTWEASKETPTEDPNVPDKRARIEIEYKSIKITGNIEHFKNIPQEVELEGYSDSEKKLIYIYARETWQSPVAYITWETGTSYPRTKMLTLGDASEGENFREDFRFVEQ